MLIINRFLMFYRLLKKLFNYLWGNFKIKRAKKRFLLNLLDCSACCKLIGLMVIYSLLASLAKKGKKLKSISGRMYSRHLQEEMIRKNWILLQKLKQFKLNFRMLLYLRYKKFPNYINLIVQWSTLSCYFA